MTNSVVSIHQPGYLPWLGYFHKIYSANTFVYHDNVQFSKNSMYRRTYILNNRGVKCYLVVPLVKHSDYELLKNLEIANLQQWQKEHLNKIKCKYHKANYFNKYFNDIADIIMNSKNTNNFCDFIFCTLTSLCSILNINTPLYRSSNLPVSGYKTEYNILLVKHFKSNIYLSGSGAFKSYQKVSDFENEGICVIKQDIYDFIQNKNYYQPNPFINGLSIVDPLFNIGADGIISIFNEYNSIMFHE